MFGSQDVLESARSYSEQFGSEQSISAKNESGSSMALLMDVRGVVVLGGIAFEAISERLDFQSEGSCFGRKGQDQLLFHSICGAHEGLDGEIIGAVHHGGDPGGADFHPRGELVSVQA
jgi:hypothetical protein